MAQQEQFVDEISYTARMDGSANGNPRYRVHFKSGKAYPTAVDASVAYGINNPELNSGPVRVTLEREQITYVRPEPVELEEGMRVTVRTDDDGRFVGIVDHFEREGNVAVIMPTREAVRDVFPKGYRLGRAHWAAKVEQIADR